MTISRETYTRSRRHLLLCIAGVMQLRRPAVANVDIEQALEHAVLLLDLQHDLVDLRRAYYQGGT